MKPASESLPKAYLKGYPAWHSGNAYIHEDFEAREPSRFDPLLLENIQSVEEGVVQGDQQGNPNEQGIVGDHSLVNLEVPLENVVVDSVESTSQQEELATDVDLEEDVEDDSHVDSLVAGNLPHGLLFN